MIPFRFIVCASLGMGIALNAAYAQEAKFHPVSLGVQMSFFAPPFPALGAVSGNITLLDLLRVQGDLGLGQAVVAKAFRINTFSWGGTALVRVPRAQISPIAGLSLSQNYIDETDSAFQHMNQGQKHTQKFLSPLVGIEVKRDKKLYYGVGVFIPFRDRDGSWRKESYEVNNIITGKTFHLSILPFGYLGIALP